MQEGRIECGDKWRHQLWRRCQNHIQHSSEGRAKITGHFWHVEENTVYMCRGGTSAGHEASHSRLLTPCSWWHGGEGGKSKNLVG